MTILAFQKELFVTDNKLKYVLFSFGKEKTEELYLLKVFKIQCRKGRNTVTQVRSLWSQELGTKETAKLTLPQNGVMEIQYSMVLPRDALQLNIIQLNKVLWVSKTSCL